MRTRYGGKGRGGQEEGEDGVGIRGSVLGVWTDGRTYLGEAVEAEPDAGAEALFFLRVPLACEEGEAGGDGGFEDAEEEADGDCTGVVFYGCEAGENYPPHDDVEGRWGGRLVGIRLMARDKLAVFS